MAEQAAEQWASKKTRCAGPIEVLGPERKDGVVTRVSEREAGESTRDSRAPQSKRLQQASTRQRDCIAKHTIECQEECGKGRPGEGKEGRERDLVADRKSEWKGEKSSQPTERFELSTYRLRSDRNNHYATWALTT